MDLNLVKQAYAYGAAIALQELGFDAQRAEVASIKLAEDAMEEGEDSKSAPVRAGIGAGFGVPVGGLLGALGGSAYSDLRHPPTPYRGGRHFPDAPHMGHQLGSALGGAGLGALGGGIGGAALTQAGVDNPLAASIGAGLGAIPGMAAGALAGDRIDNVISEAVRRGKGPVSRSRVLGIHGARALPLIGGIGGGIGGGALADYLARKFKGDEGGEE